MLSMEGCSSRTLALFLFSLVLFISLVCFRLQLKNTEGTAFEDINRQLKDLNRKIGELEQVHVNQPIFKAEEPSSCVQCFSAEVEADHIVPLDISTSGEYPGFVFPVHGASHPHVLVQHEQKTCCPSTSPYSSRPQGVHPITQVRYEERCDKKLLDTGKNYLPIFYQYSCYKGIVPPGLSLISAIGQMTPQYMHLWGSNPVPDSKISSQELIFGYLDSLGEEYFEHAAVLEAVYYAKNKLIAVELGAGTGRWLGMAFHGNIQLRNLPVLLIGVEADWMHFQHLRTNLLSNGVREHELQLWKAAVGTQIGRAKFTVGNSHGWYGQSLTKFDEALGAPSPEKASVIEVDVIDLGTIIEPHDHIDYLDLDIQYSERPVIEKFIQEIDKKVRYMWVEIHDEKDCLPIRALMRERGWLERYAACCGGGVTSSNVVYGDSVKLPYGMSYTCSTSSIFVRNPKLF